MTLDPRKTKTMLINAAQMALQSIATPQGYRRQGKQSRRSLEANRVSIAHVSNNRTVVGKLYTFGSFRGYSAFRVTRAVMPLAHPKPTM